VTDIFLERRFDPALSPAAVMELARQADGCFGIHRIEWHGSLLSLDGHRMLCWFSAPDMESARIAMRQIDADTRVIWRGNVYDGDGIVAKDIPTANVLVERSFENPVMLQEIQEIEDAGVSCLENRNVRFIRTFFSSDQKRMICLYQAPDADSVRQAQRQAGVPFDDAWAFRAVGPDAPEDTTN